MSETATSEATSKPPLSAEEAAARLVVAAAPSWRDNDRVKVTPTHFEIEIYKWAESTNKARRHLEENPDNRPPDVVKVRRRFTAGDSIAMDGYPDDGAKHREMAICCILTEIEWDMMNRMSYPDYRIVVLATDDAVSGKE